MRQPSFVKLIKNSLLQGKSVGKNGLECQDKRGHNICRYFGIFCQKYNLTALDADNKMNKRSFKGKNDIGPDEGMSARNSEYSIV